MQRGIIMLGIDKLNWNLGKESQLQWMIYVNMPYLEKNTVKYIHSHINVRLCMNAA